MYKKKTRRCYDREFKLSVVAELEGGKPPAQIAREQGIHSSLPSRWRDELAENPERNEKIIKAIYVQKRNEHAPQIHNLVRLAEQAGIVLSTEQKETLIIITAFNLESRYPDEKRSFRIKCTEQYTKVELAKIREVIKWLKSIM